MHTQIVSGSIPHERSLCQDMDKKMEIFSEQLAKSIAETAEVYRRISTSRLTNEEALAIATLEEGLRVSMILQ